MYNLMHWLFKQQSEFWEMILGYCNKLFFYKELVGSALSPQSCLYFQGFQGSNLLNVCLVVLPSNLCLRGIEWFSGFKINIIFDQWF